MFTVTKIFNPSIYKVIINPSNFSIIKNLVTTTPTRTIFLAPSTTTTTIDRKYSQDKISALHVKKRPVRKKKTSDDDVKLPGIYTVAAFSTGEEYNLENLINGLKVEDLYEPNLIDNAGDVVHAVAKYQVDKEPREIFFFREGGVVMWNISELESSNIRSFLKQFESDSYPADIVRSETECMNYSYRDEEGLASTINKDGDFILSKDTDNVTFDKYTFSNAMSLSVKLGVWEALLEKYIDSIEVLTEDLKRGEKIRLSREAALRKHGELFSLRHLINLSSDLLDTPDFYWDNEHLEQLYLQVCSYFCISKRTRVMNEKINHCIELIELLSSQLNDKHHVRLEWMIIILIMVEVGFEIIHYIDRYMH